MHFLAAAASSLHPTEQSRARTKRGSQGNERGFSTFSVLQFHPRQLFPRAFGREIVANERGRPASGLPGKEILGRRPCHLRVGPSVWLCLSGLGRRMEPAQVFRLANSSSDAIRQKWAGNRARVVVEDTREGGGGRGAELHDSFALFLQP